MSMKRFLPIAVIVALLAPTVAILPGALAQDTVPTTTVPYQPVPGVPVRFYLNIANGQNGQPDCATYTLGLRTNTSTPDAPRLACPQAGSVTTPLGAGAPATISFALLNSLKPIRAVTLPGNNSITYHHSATATAAGTTGTGGTGPITVTLASGGTTLATGTVAVGSNTATLALSGTSAATGRAILGAGQAVTVTISAPATTWSFSDVDAYIELRSDDAIKAALWVTDERSAARTVFQPIPNGTTPVPDRRIVGHFSLSSAFGIDEVMRGDAPKFQILRNGTEAKEIGAGGATVLTGAINNTLSNAPNGIASWSFPSGSATYMGFPAGNYVVHADKTHNGAAITRASDAPFQITAQSVRIEPFRDPRVPTLLEVEAHTVVPGESTTYLLGVVNTGTVNDTFTLNVTAPNPPPGWSATLGGPDVRGRNVFVPAGNTSLVTVTVSAPLNAGAADRITHLVNATSTIDPSARSTDRTLVTTVGLGVTRELGIVVTASNLSVEPGGSREIPVYVWNRGTRTTNVSLETPATGTGGWSAQLIQGSTGVERIVVNNLAPGAIGEATLRVNGPPNEAVKNFPVRLNATAIESAGVATDRTLTFVLSAVPGVSMKILDSANGQDHRVELGTDGVNGAWFRAWISNTGRVSESFDLSVDSITLGNPTCGDGGSGPGGLPVGGGGGGATTPFIDTTFDGQGDFGFWFRSPSGNPQRVTSVGELAAGKTAEVYFYVPVDPAGPACADNTLSFVMQAKGSQTGVIARASAIVTAENTPTHGQGAVYVEAVGRETTYASGSPHVNIADAERRQITGAVEVGKEITYLLRVTDGSSFQNWVDGTQVGDPTVHVVIEGVDRDAGWNASVRPVLDTTENTEERNPYVAEYNLSNVNRFASNRREAWIDRELQVRIQAPNAENGTALAGEQDQVIVRAFINGSQVSSLEIKTVIGQFANITTRPEATRIFAHPGEGSPFLIHVANNGSSAATVTLRANINSETTQNAAAWRIEGPNSQSFPLAAFKNRTVAISVTPPAGAAQGSTGEVNLTVEYAESPLRPSVTKNTTTRLTAEIVAPGTLQLTSNESDKTIGPGGFASYTMTLRNSGGLTVPYNMRVTDIPNWTETLSPASGQLAPGESRPVVLVLRAPEDALNEARFAAVVNVEEVGATNNFDALAFTANILGGKPVPSLSVPQLTKRVDRGGETDFEVSVKNLGSAAGKLTLELRSTESSWNTSIRGPRGDRIDSLTLAPNELATINVTVEAPFNVPERFFNTVEVTALTEDRSQASRAALQAEIHDYGVSIETVPSSLEGLPGLPTELTLRVRNTGNDNDTLNVSADLRDLPDWGVQFSQDEIRLEPGATGELRATIRSPVSPLPTSRTYTFPFWVGTRGGQDVNIPKNMTANVLLTIPSYRYFDVDRDASQEIVVDLDRRSANGFEVFREAFTDGVQSQVVAAAALDGKTRFFLDVPSNGKPYDGIADVWFDPEGLFAFPIESTPDLNQDGTPDYLIDTDHDAKIDMAYDTVTDRYFTAVEIQAFGDDRTQYLVDLTGDGKPDRYYDPDANLVTRTSASGTDRVGIDTDNDNSVDKYYDVKSKAVSDAKVAQFSDFARSYWYFFLAFGVLVVLVIALIVVRRR